jgi:hypothetical protein
MKSARFITVLVLAVAATGVAQKESVEETIRKLDNERIQAQIHADAAALDRIYATDFIGVGPSGTVRTKRQVISDFTSGTLKFQSITTDEVRCASTKTRRWRLAFRRWLGKTRAKRFPEILGLPGCG